MRVGWVKIHRAIEDHWIWDEPRHLKWWITILLNVNHDHGKVLIGEAFYNTKPGESFISIERWA